MRRWWIWAALIAGASLALDLASLPRPFAGLDSWRDAHTFGVARNFLEEGFDVLRPRVDLRGTGTGMLPGEFPLYAAVSAAAMGVAGIHPWIARLVDLLLYLTGAWLLFRVAMRAGLDRWAATLAVLLYLTNAILAKQGTAIMSDTASNVLALAAAAVVLPVRRDGAAGSRWLRLLIGSGFVTLATLVKPSGLCVVGLLGIWVVARAREEAAGSAASRLVFAASAALLLVCVPLAVHSGWQHFTMTFEYPVYMSFQEPITHHYDRTRAMILRELTAPNVFAAVKKALLHGLNVAGMLGVVALGVQRLRKTQVAAVAGSDPAFVIGLLGWTAACLLFLFTAGDVQTHQTYYAAPIAVPLILLGALCLSRLPPAVALALLTLQLAAMGNFFRSSVFEDRAHWSAFALEPAADQISRRTDLFVAKGTPADFTMLGRLGRRGIVLSDAAELRSAFATYPFFYVREPAAGELAEYQQLLGTPVLIQGGADYFFRTPASRPVPSATGR